MKIGAFDAKAQFSSLLERAQHGEEIVITKHGRPVARLVSVADVDDAVGNSAWAELKRLRKETTLGGISWRDLRDAGRK